MSTSLQAMSGNRGRPLFLGLLLLLACAGAAAAQGASTLKGQVVDPAGKPVGAQKLTLHRVNATGGALVDSATTDAQGRFSFRIPAERDTSALYFGATRWQGELYIGQPFKPPVPAGESYVVTVGVNPVQMGPASGGGPGGMGGQPAPGAVPPAAAARDASNGRWFLVIILALVAIGSIAYALLRGSGEQRAVRERRELLARIAELDERAAAGAPGDDLAALQRERAELLARLSGD